MKNYNFYLIAIISLFLLLTACEDINNSPKEEKSINGYFRLYQLTPFLPPEYGWDLQLSGFIYYKDDENRVAIDAGKLYISNYELEFEIDSLIWGDTIGYILYTNIKDLEKHPTFGDKGVWGFSGNQKLGINEFYVDLYTPLRPEIKEPVSNFSKIDKNGFYLKWDFDSNLDSIYIVTDIPDSVVHELAPPFFSTNNWIKSVPDNGVYFISPDILDILSSSDTVSIGLIRMISDTVSDDNKYFIFERRLSDYKKYIIE